MAADPTLSKRGGIGLRQEGIWQQHRQASTHWDRFENGLGKGDSEIKATPKPGKPGTELRAKHLVLVLWRDIGRVAHHEGHRLGLGKAAAQDEPGSGTRHPCHGEGHRIHVRPLEGRHPSAIQSNEEPTGTAGGVPRRWGARNRAQARGDHGLGEGWRGVPGSPPTPLGAAGGWNGCAGLHNHCCPRASRRARRCQGGQAQGALCWCHPHPSEAAGSRHDVVCCASRIPHRGCGCGCGRNGVGAASSHRQPRLQRNARSVHRLRAAGSQCQPAS